MAKEDIRDTEALDLQIVNKQRHLQQLQHAISSLLQNIRHAAQSKTEAEKRSAQAEANARADFLEMKLKQQALEIVKV